MRAVGLSLALGLAQLGCGGGQSLGTRPDGAAPYDGAMQPDATTGPDADLCGVGDDEKVARTSTRVYNGTAEPEQCVSPAQQRAVVALLFNYGSWSNGCTATLISDTAVLTAAHCVRGWNGTLSPNEVRVAVGRDSAQPEATLRVSAVFAHPQYRGEADHDVGLLLLRDPVSSAGVDVIPIPPNTEALGSDFVGTWVQNVGFGATESNDNNHLRFWTTEEVTEVLPGEFLVYGQGVSSVCYGDSGGPSLYLLGGDHLAVIGTVSWGDQSCVDYDHFARTDDNQAFIEDNAGPIDPCAGIDELGRCDGDVALWCEGGRLRQQCCAETGSTCVQDPGSRARCNDACAGLTWEGRCADNVAEWCEGGEIRRRHCTPCNQTCRWTGDVLGYYCEDP